MKHLRSGLIILASLYVLYEMLGGGPVLLQYGTWFDTFVMFIILALPTSAVLFVGSFFSYRHSEGVHRYIALVGMIIAGVVFLTVLIPIIKYFQFNGDVTGTGTIKEKWG